MKCFTCAFFKNCIFVNLCWNAEGVKFSSSKEDLDLLKPLVVSDLLLNINASPLFSSVHPHWVFHSISKLKFNINCLLISASWQSEDVACGQLQVTYIKQNMENVYTTFLDQFFILFNQVELLFMLWSRINDLIVVLHGAHFGRLAR